MLRGCGINDVNGNDNATNETFDWLNEEKTSVHAARAART